MPAPTPYIGPRPSPARPWAPWVIGGAALIALGNAAQCGLNLLERHYQQQRGTSHPPSLDQVRAAVNAIRTLSTLTAVLLVAWLILAIVWSKQRRPRARLHAFGESSVEPALRSVTPTLWWAMWIGLALALVASLVARGAVHPAMSVDDFVRYRGYLALSDLGRAVAWMCWALMAARATSLQDERERSSTPPRPLAYASAGWPPRPSEPSPV
jgi:hypothetical protein